MKRTATQSDQAWFDHVAEMARLHDVKATELVAGGWRRSGPRRTPRFSRNGETVMLARQLGTATWYTVNV